jgi:dipeptidyl aminopeptidase/acylaminoacyl peptidase
MTDYREFVPGQRLGKTLSLSADGAMVAYPSDASGQFNLCVQPTGSGPARQLTSFTDQAVREVAWAPDGSLLAFTADTCGDEQTQVYLIPSAGGTPELVSSGTGQHYLAEKSPFDPTGRYLLYSGDDRDGAVADLIVHEVATGRQTRFPGLPGGPGSPVAMSPDQRYVLTLAMGANTDCQACLADLGRPGSALEPVTADLPGKYFHPMPWTADGTGFYVLAIGADGDHLGLSLFTLADRALADRALAPVASPPWDVEDAVVSADGRTVVWIVNEDGSSVLRGQRAGQDLFMPRLPDGLVRAMNVSADGDVLALLLETPGRPREVALASPGRDEPVRYLTDTRPPAIRASDPALPELIRYPADDGTPIPALLYRPPGPGPHPVLLSIHGGPDMQTRPDYGALHQCLLASGIAVLAPNIRGSSGYGLAWRTRVYRDWGGIDLADLAAAHAWLAAQPWAAPGKIAVYGMSYGGFASLSCMTRLPDLWAAGVVVCGPSNLETLGRAMPGTWASTVAAHFGDLDDPDNVAELRRRSPLTYAGQVSAPLLVIQGATDPRVPQAEADQIVSAARDVGADVQYEVFADEGHGFTSRDNDAKAHTLIAEFLAARLR